MCILLTGILDLDKYIQADEELICLLNSDYIFAPKLLHAVAQLHTASIFSIDDELITMYHARSKGIDAHAEISTKS